jgi:hypothetical protein
MAGGADLAGRTGSGAAGWLRAVLLTALLLALSWQSYVVGTHAHQPVASGPAGAILHRAPAQDRRAPAAPDPCPICQQISIAAAYLPAPPVTVAAPALALVWYGATATLVHLPPQRSHAWRSRGPPTAPAVSM